MNWTMSCKCGNWITAISVIAASMILLSGCDEHEHQLMKVKYNALTGKKLPEKVDHLKDATAEAKNVNGFCVVRYVLEGHVYYANYSDASAFTHSEACPCKTNNLSK